MPLKGSHVPSLALGAHPGVDLPTLGGLDLRLPLRRLCLGYCFRHRLGRRLGRRPFARHHRLCIHLVFDTQLLKKCRCPLGSGGVLGVARVLLTDDEFAQVMSADAVESTGERAATVELMCDRRTTDMAKVASLLLDSVLRLVKAGEPEPEGVAEAAAERRASGVVGAGLKTGAVAATHRAMAADGRSDSPLGV